VHKELIILGLLAEQPMHGHELHRIVAAHGELYADLKKANLYHLLRRLHKCGYLRVRTEAGTRGRRGERLHYSLTASGRAYLKSLLHEIVRNYASVHSGIEVATVLLSGVPLPEAIALLRARRQAVLGHKAMLESQFADLKKRGPFAQISADHLIGAADAELAWVDRALRRLRARNA
jgi:DNA-binding PadR family transcriptional regulator